MKILDDFFVLCYERTSKWSSIRMFIATIFFAFTPFAMDAAFKEGWGVKSFYLLGPGLSGFLLSNFFGVICKQRRDKKATELADGSQGIDNNKSDKST